MVNKTLSADLLGEALPIMLDYGLREKPYEAVGILCPDGRVYPLQNEAHCVGAYLVNGKQLEAALQDILVEGVTFGFWDLVIWHTHPSGLVGPSAGDLSARRQEPLNDLAHLVVTLPTGEAVYY